MSSARPADDDGGRAPPSRDAFAGLESLVRTPDDEVDVDRDDDGMDGMILGLSEAAADDAAWQLDSFEPTFGESPPTAAALQFQFMDPATSAAAPTAVDDRAINAQIQMIDSVAGALVQPAVPHGVLGRLQSHHEADVPTEFAPAASSSPNVDHADSSVAAAAAAAAAAAVAGATAAAVAAAAANTGDPSLEQQRTLATTPARPAEMPPSGALQQQHQQQQQNRYLQLKQQQEHQLQQRQEQQKQQHEQHQLQLAQLEAASRLAAGAGAAKPVSKQQSFPSVCRYCGRTFSSESSASFRQHEQACRRSRRPPMHSSVQRPLSGAITRSPSGGGHQSLGGAIVRGRGPGSATAAAAAAAGAAAAEAVAAAATGNVAAGGMFAQMASSSMPPIPPGSAHVASEATGSRPGQVSPRVGVDRVPSRGLSDCGVDHGSLSRRDTELINTVRRVMGIISGIDVSARTCLRDALLSLSNKAANPDVQPTPEQEALNRAAEYLVLRMLFLSGQQVPHTAPGTGGTPAGGSVGALPSPTAGLHGPVSHAGPAHIAPPADLGDHLKHTGSIGDVHSDSLKSLAESGVPSPSNSQPGSERGPYASPGMASASSAEVTPCAPTGLSPSASGKHAKDDNAVVPQPKLEPKIEPSEESQHHP